jgi:hypothetical protein
MRSKLHLEWGIQAMDKPADKFAPGYCSQCGSPLYDPKLLASSPPFCWTCSPATVPLALAESLPHIYPH